MKATLYVKGVRTAVEEELVSGGYVSEPLYRADGRIPTQARASPYYDVKKKTTYKSVLPEDQKAVVEMVKAAALKYGFELKVADVSEESFLQKFEGRSKGINEFPAFVTDNGLRIEGDISEEQIKALLKPPAHGGRQVTKNRLVR